MNLKIILTQSALVNDTTTFYIHRKQTHAAPPPSPPTQQHPIPSLGVLRAATTQLASRREYFVCFYWWPRISPWNA
ncbi:hypothetical protein E2C01_076728 [Portunus trituberculatus]|uniref:Uncharacterized protein n=1 Tax=Portunus trituberculatus TaxID=210409 RepID=A0A5B7IID7_PORTR|nr:hypothetical protein [Portunus trituberculatus]